MQTANLQPKTNTMNLIDLAKVALVMFIVIGANDYLIKPAIDKKERT